MRDGRNDRERERSEAAPLDPIALTLAIWLGTVVLATALGRLVEDAAARAALARPLPPPPAAALVMPDQRLAPWVR